MYLLISHNSNKTNSFLSQSFRHTGKMTVISTENEILPIKKELMEDFSPPRLVKTYANYVVEATVLTWGWSL